ncbi:FadR family transcriptional regulator [Acuticoccus sp. M5D2P5]|uniref:FadR/GntR family transcriptional regulator n=1 Tax=Acuticoccus kalidii TaxID=2910977 RepID=UPI001F361A68|nr:FadR/GntR family transcriptional regulator [Acuticoccus kalidii]MCF3931985.1 FadR family transcriptional regulator [Acuticoccus kalidii]
MSTWEEPAAPQKKSRRNLVIGVINSLRTDILEGLYKPGDRLPPETRLTEKFSVSRTVIREAIAGLRADGLVEPRQGAGVFVLEPQPANGRPFEIVDFGKISAIIEMLELRAAVETEAAAIAAVRRSPAQEEAIIEACEEMRRLVDKSTSAAEVDLRFHLALADATNNPRFREFLEVMGLTAIPRSVILSPPQANTAEYLDMICEEHREVAAAVSRSDPEGAREAMRRHLKGSQQRYRDLANERAKVII